MTTPKGRGLLRINQEDMRGQRALDAAERGENTNAIAMLLAHGAQRTARTSPHEQFPAQATPAQESAAAPLPAQSIETESARRRKRTQKKDDWLADILSKTLPEYSTESTTASAPQEKPLSRKERKKKELRQRTKKTEPIRSLSDDTQKGSHVPALVGSPFNA